LLYQIVQEYWPEFQAELASHGRAYVTKEFDEYLKCGRLEHGFLRVRCEACHDEKLLAFSCKKRGFCPSCGARRMADSAALLVDEVLPHQPMRQWVLSFPFPLRFLFASQPIIMGKVLGIVYRAIATHVTRKAGYTKTTAQTGAVTLIQCFGGSLNLNIHFHMLFLDGIYADNKHGTSRFRRVKAPTSDELTQLTHTIAHRVGRYLERQSLLVRDDENSYLTAEGADTDNESPLNHLLGSSITSATAPALLYLLHPCSRTALPWDHSKGVRCSPYKPYPIVQMTRWHTGLEMSLVSHCTLGLLPEPMSELSWNACAVTSQDRRCPPNAYH
jgi:ribosomal protein S27E